MFSGGLSASDCVVQIQPFEAGTKTVAEKPGLKVQPIVIKDLRLYNYEGKKTFEKREGPYRDPAAGQIYARRFEQSRKI